MGLPILPIGQGRHSSPLPGESPRDPIVSLLERLKERKLVQWALAYLTGAWLLLQVCGELRDTFGWRPVFVQALALLLAVGFLGALVLAWYHGEKGQQRVSGPELLMLAGIFAIAAALMTGLSRSTAADPAAARLETPPAGAGPAEPSIAVLPFKNLSSDPENEYFSEGMTDEILTTLAEVRGLRVISRTSVMQYKETTKPIRQVASELGVANVLEGSVQRTATRVRIQAQLIDAARDTHLWAHRYDRPIEDLFAVQSEIASEIAHALQSELTPAEKSRMERRPTADITAHDLVLRAREYFYRYTTRDNDVALGLFRRALDLDPRYVDAVIGLADTYRLKGQAFGGGQAWEDSAVATARRAIALDPASARAYDALGWALNWEERDGEARAAYLKAIELNPDLTGGLADLYLHGYGRLDEALRLFKHALTVNPTDPILTDLTGWTYETLGMFEQARGYYERCIEIQPVYIQPYSRLLRVSLLMGRPDDAQAVVRRMLAGFGEVPPALFRAGDASVLMGNLVAARGFYERGIAASGGLGQLSLTQNLPLAWFYQQAGEAARTREIIPRIASHPDFSSPNKNPDTFARLARLRVLQGNKEDAIRQMEIAVRRGWRDYYLLPADPILRSLRGDPRFDRLMAELKAVVDGQRARVEREGW
jgi:TolB-like protein